MKRSGMFLVAAMMAAVAAMPVVARAQADGPGQAASSDDQHRLMAGSVQSFNYGPRGVEGIVLSTNEGIVQLNMMPELAAQVVQSVAQGDAVKVMGQIDNGPPPPPPGGQDGNGGGPQGGPGGGPGGDGGQGPQADHPVYRLITLTDAKGKQYTAPGPGGRKEVHVEGTVKFFNYDRRGMVNGVHLDNGDVVHVGPREMEELALAPGKKVTVDGMGQALQGGGQLINAWMVNGMNVRPQGPGGPGGGGQGGPGGNGPPPQ